MIDSNWNRWTYTSVVKHFFEHSKKNNIPLYLNRYDRDSDWAELRFNGPYINEASKGCFYITVNVDLLITCSLLNDQYKINRMMGIYNAAFTSICVYKYGDTEEDDHSFLGELKLSDGTINSTNYSLIYPESKFVRATVEADYSMVLL